MMHWITKLGGLLGLAAALGWAGPAHGQALASTDSATVATATAARCAYAQAMH